MSITTYICRDCQAEFSKHCLLQRHIERKNGCLKNQKSKDRSINAYVCDCCTRGFTRSSDLSRHFKICPVLKKQEEKQLKNDQVEILKQEMQRQNQEMYQKLSQLIDQKCGSQLQSQSQSQSIINVNNNTLQVLCVGPQDNYLDMLSQEMGFDRALEFVIGCALSDHNGDLRLMEKVYITNRKAHECPIRILDYKKGKFQFTDENHQVVIDPNGHVLGRRICGNLQSTYLKGISHLSMSCGNPDNKESPRRILEDYDIVTGNKHVYKLSDSKMHNKIMKLFTDKLYLHAQQTL